MFHKVRPLKRHALDGEQTAGDEAPMMYVLRNEMPFFTKLSILGVFMFLLPHAFMVSYRWSSVKRKWMLGRSSSAWQKTELSQLIKSTLNKGNFIDLLV